MNESEKRKVAREIKINAKILIYSVILGIASYPLLALYDGGFKALRLAGEYQYVISDKDKLKGYCRDVISLGYKNKTLRHDVYYSDFRDLKDYDPSHDTLWEEFSDRYLIFGSVYNVSTNSLNSTITISLYSYTYTLKSTIEKIFGRYGILRSLWVFVITFLGIITFRYLFLFIRKSLRWIKKYS